MEDKGVEYPYSSQVGGMVVVGAVVVEVVTVSMQEHCCPLGQVAESWILSVPGGNGILIKLHTP